ncbi:MAG: TonB-dependent receptor [Asticcacaulis sp.]
MVTRTHTLRAFLLAGTASGLMFASAAVAQNTGETVEEVIVTAQKRSSSLQKTPLAITALSAQEVSAKGVTGVTEAVKFIPSVQVNQTNTGSGFYIRGIGSRNAGNLPDSPVATMIDGVLIQRTELISQGFADLNRIEVLRGPQGTLYGRNANAGVVNIITNDPRLGEYGGSVSLQAGNYDALRTEGVVNIPLGDKWAVRAVYASNDHDGYLSNGLMDAGEQMARLKVLYKPHDDFKLLLGIESDKVDSHGPGNVLLPTSGRKDPWQAPDYSSLYTIPTGDPIYCNPKCEGIFDVDNTRLFAQADWSLGFANLTAIASRQDFEREYAQPFSGLWETDTLPVTQDSLELRLSSPASSAISWVVGAYWLDYDGGGEIKRNYTFDQLTELRENSAKSEALFGQITYPVTPSLRLTGGLRYTKDELSSVSASGTLSGGITDVGTQVKQSYDKVTHRVGIEYDLAPNSLIYASHSTGIKSGGVNANGFGYEPEEITAIEAGIKNRFLNGRLMVNIDAYHYDYTGYQMSYYYYIGQVPTFLTANVDGKTKVNGLEIESQWRVTPKDRLTATLSLQKSKFGNAEIAASCDPTGACTTEELTGRSLPRVPETTLTVGYERTWDLSDGAVVRGGVNAQWKEGYEVDILTFNHSTTKSYSLWNANVSYDAPDGKWSIGAYVNNITDTAVLEQANTAGPVDVYGVIGTPRTYGLRLTGHF